MCVRTFASLLGEQERATAHAALDAGFVEAATKHFTEMSQELSAPVVHAIKLMKQDTFQTAMTMASNVRKLQAASIRASLQWMSRDNNMADFLADCIPGALKDFQKACETAESKLRVLPT